MRLNTARSCIDKVNSCDSSVNSDTSHFPAWKSSGCFTLTLIVAQCMNSNHDVIWEDSVKELFLANLPLRLAGQLAIGDKCNAGRHCS